jgi:acyl-CoA reductase-like NAD-dependent aldehyde dehydrogenase
MSAQNGQRARFHRNRKRSVVRRQRVQALMADLLKKKADAATATASNEMRSEGGPPAAK